MVNWPEEYKWKLGSNQENESVHMMEVVPGDENIENWTMLGTMMSYKNVKISHTNQVVEIYQKASKELSSKSQLTVLERDDSAANLWVLFKIETPSFPEDPKPEPQLYYAIQSESTLYVIFISIKEKKLSKEFVNKWSEVFKASKLTYM